MSSSVTVINPPCWHFQHDDYQPSTCIGSPGKVVDQNNDMRIRIISRPPGFQCQYLPYIFRLNASIYDMYWLYYGKFVCGLMPWRFHVIHRRLLPPPSTSIVVCCCRHPPLPPLSAVVLIVHRCRPSICPQLRILSITSAHFLRKIYPQFTRCNIRTSAFYH